MKRFNTHWTNKSQQVFGVARLAMMVSGVLCTACSPMTPGKIKVQGMVTLDGVVLPEGQVVFIPSNPSLGAAGGAIADGVFTVTTYKGPHRIEVHAHKKQTRPMPSGAPLEAGDSWTSIIPQRYNEKTTLTFDVQSPSDRPEFALTSDK